ncbi:ABC-2 transporter permease [Paenibacillus sp. N1-5-1-14]|uniref:ABC-2 transporter permease n=1 Tax=Paenibacillus radicibacter TaxID=2972488 RepID=UPI002158F8ED|nr:ABC-2 transporter permease [Paenibacillus radicibacter]MCR8645469.1 ABC-2 transporter permease [Paenibacillus radicibacter]
MVNLLHKDFIALKSSQWMVLLYLVVFSIVFIPKMDMSLYFIGIYTAFGSIMLATMVDIKNNNYKFLITLPISRKHIVRAKYLTAVLYTLFGFLASIIIHWICSLAIPQLNKPEVTIWGVLLAIGMVLVLISIYMPLFYALSKKGAGVINAVFLVSMILLANPAAMLINMMGDNSSSNVRTFLIVCIGILAVFIASYHLTVYLFKKKDL